MSTDSSTRARAAESTRGKGDARDRHITINQHDIGDCQYVDYFIFYYPFSSRVSSCFILSLHSHHLFSLHTSFAGFDISIFFSIRI